MVDAVSAINGAINSTVQKNKDLTIDWRNLKAQEVLDYAGQGQDVPIDILKWAEDYAKLEDAPEDVTYDSVGGATTLKDANEKAGQAGDVDASSEAENSEDAKKAEEEKKVEDTEGTGNPQDTDATGDEEDVAAESEPSLYEQAGALIPQSQDGNTTANMISADSLTKAAESQEIAEEGTQKADRTESIVKSAKSQYDELVKKLQDDKENVTPGDLLKLQELSGRMQITGLKAQSELAVFDVQLQEIEEVFSQYSDMTPEIQEVGSETVTVGNELVKQNPPDWPFIFSNEYMRGKEAIRVGSSAISSADNARDRVDDSINKENAAQNTNNEAEDKVEELTYVEEINISSKTDKRAAQKAERQEARNKNSAAVKIQLDGVKDTTIQADDLEIKRRKANRGENPY